MFKTFLNDEGMVVINNFKQNKINRYKLIHPSIIMFQKIFLVQIVWR